MEPTWFFSHVAVYLAAFAFCLPTVTDLLLISILEHTSLENTATMSPLGLIKNLLYSCIQLHTDNKAETAGVLWTRMVDTAKWKVRDLECSENRNKSSLYMHQCRISHLCLLYIL